MLRPRLEVGAGMTTPLITCLDCGATLQHDTEAESWLHRPILFDPDTVDIDHSGEICSETGEEHRVTPDTPDTPNTFADCGSGQCDPNTGCPACNEDRDHWARAK